MKLKGLGSRAYNVLFHTHTVAGIVISFALFVIFYAGAFSLFRHEIMQWENPEARRTYDHNFDYQKAIDKVDSVYQLNWYQTTNIVLPEEGSPFLVMYGAVNVTDSTTNRMAAYVTSDAYEVQDLKNPKTTVGTTIYFLHYFRQIPVVGLYLSGLVALFFLFASVTGVLIHWRNLLTKFYAFVTKGKWKTIWTNAHTVLGMIGLPFQMMYAITGAFFGLLTLILLPSVFLLYDGDTNKVFNKIRVENTIKPDPSAPDTTHLSFNEVLMQVQSRYPDLTVTRVALKNFGKTDAIATWRLDDKKNILSGATITTRMSDGDIIESASVQPISKPYSQAVLDMMYKLHFGEFGGMAVKIIYFVLSMITCFMIVSGVLIWRTARDNNNYTLNQRLFHHRVTKVYLAICLSMFPAFAMIFIANKLVPMDWIDRTSWVNTIFFAGWFCLIILGLFRNSYARQNRSYLIVGGVLSVFVPIANGLVTGDWIWYVWNSLPRVAYVDFAWLIAGIASLYISFKVLKISNKTDRPEEEIINENVSEKKQPARNPKSRPKMLKPELAFASKK